MPSAFTHAFSGAAIAGLAPPALRRGKLALILAVVAAIPDLDVLGFAIGIPYDHPLGHRGFSHSLTFALLIAAVLPTLMYRDTPRFSRSGIALFALCFAACASHGFLDAFTDAGLGIGFFVPFDNRRYFFPCRPVTTSPLSVRAFFAGRAFGILRNEMTWIWLPICALCLIIATVRSLRARRQRE
jgi:inner membrane protein